MRSKVHYRPVEAAIRWCGLERHERVILEILKNKQIPSVIDFPRWPNLRLNTERIYDGILNGELRYALGGVVIQRGSSVDRPELAADLTVRHVDLKVWMTNYYPEHKPSFLFSRNERERPPAIALKLQIEQILPNHHISPVLPCEQESASDSQARSGTGRETNEGLGPRSEATYLHVVGGLLSLLLGRSPSGQPYSTFRTQEAIISAMVAHHGQRLGVSQRTLETKFAAAKRALSRD